MTKISQNIILTVHQVQLIFILKYQFLLLKLVFNITPKKLKYNKIKNYKSNYYGPYSYSIKTYLNNNPTLKYLIFIIIYFISQ